MSVSIARRRLLLSLPVWPSVLTGCIDDGGPPRIDSFTASSTRVLPGASVSLLAQFDDGAGVIDRGVGRVRSGVPIEVTPDGNTVYTLTVHNGSGEVTAQVGVQPGLLRAWDFAVDTPETWGDPHARVVNGKLLVSSTPGAEMGDCGYGDETTHDDPDPLWRSGGYGALRLSANLEGYGELFLGYGELSLSVYFGVHGIGFADLIIDIPETGLPTASINGIPCEPNDLHVAREPGVQQAYIRLFADWFCWADGGFGDGFNIRTLRLESV